MGEDSLMLLLIVMSVWCVGICSPFIMIGTRLLLVVVRLVAALVRFLTGVVRGVR